MGVPYTTLKGAIPDFRTMEFFDYFEDPVTGLIAQRLANVPLARTTTYFFSRATRAGGRAPHDTNNDGRDGIGFNLATATYTAATRTLTKTGGFTSYVWQPGDLIYLSSGVTAGLYKIASRTDANNVVLAAAADSSEGSLAAPAADASGIASSSGPFTTIAKAQALNDAVGGGTANIRYRFARGRTGSSDRGWNETTGLSISKANTTVDSYGNGGKPFFNRFHTAYSGGWTQDGVTNRWTRTVAASVIWVREVKNRFRAYQQIANQGSAGANVTKVQTTSYSFDINGTTLGMNFGGLNPNTAQAGGPIDIEVSTISSTTPALFSNGVDNVRFQGLRVDGWNQNQTTQAYAILLTATSGQEVVLWDCESYFTGYHCIGTSCVASGGGGIFTIGRCRAGYATPWTGETMINTFSPGADSEFIVYECDVPWGSLPSDSWVSTTDPTQGRGQAYFGHTSVGGATHALQLNLRCRSGLANSPYVPADPIPTFSGLPTATTTLSAYRGFVVDFRCTGFQDSYQTPIVPDNTVMINPIIELLPRSISTGILTAGGSGIMINGIVRIDCIKQAVTGFPVGLSLFVTASTAQVWHSHLELLNAQNQCGIVSAAGAAGTVKLFNSVAGTAENPFNNDLLNTTNSSTYLGGNAYYGWDTVTGAGGFDADTTGVLLSGPPIAGVPTAESPLYASGVAIPTGRVNYDILRRPRSATPSRGAYEHHPRPNDLGSVPLSTTGVFLRAGLV